MMQVLPDPLIEKTLGTMRPIQQRTFMSWFLKDEYVLATKKAADRSAIG